MADLRDFTGKNRKFTGTIGERISIGTTAERDTSFGAGTLRFNSQTSLMEYYTGVLWKSVDAPPTVTAITPTNVLTSQFPDSSTSITFAITGSLFSSGALVSFIGTDGSTITADSVTVTSQSSITATVNQKVRFLNSVDPYDVKVENVSGLFAVLDNQINVNQAVTFTNAAGSLGNFTNDGASVSVNAGGTDPEGGAIVYSVSSGALPSWASLNSSTGIITGTTTGSGTETSTFTISARDVASNVSFRQFSITTRTPVITTFNSPGTFSVPATTTSVDVLIVAGGGGSGSQHSGGGGGGGLIYRPGFPVSAGSSIPVTVGGGGGAVTDGTQPPAASNSVFNSPTGVLTAIAGGGGGRGWTNANAGHPGGSGGGGSGPGPHGGGSGTQPSQPGDSGTYGFGNPGGSTQGSPGPGGGGGGAGASGASRTPNQPGGPGGAGLTYTISGSPVTYAGGGGGGGHDNPPTGGTAGPGGGGTGGTHPGTNGQPGTNNLGGGAGGGSHGGGQGGNGGTGVVIVKS
jgi:hypothetical protein